MKLPLRFLSLVACLVLTLPAAAVTLFTDDFQSYSLNSTINTSGPWTQVSISSGAVANVINTGTPFGSTTQYLNLVDPSSTASYRIQSGDYSQAGNAVTTFQFDFYESSSGGGTNFMFGFATSGADLNTAGRRARLNLDDGVIEGLSGGTNTYSQDTAYTLYMILNDTTSSQAYGGGTLAASSVDVWFELAGGGGLTYAGSAGLFNSQDTAYRVGFRTFTGDVQDMFVDNVSFYTGAAPVPEPSVLALSAIGIAGLLRRRR